MPIFRNKKCEILFNVGLSVEVEAKTHPSHAEILKGGGEFPGSCCMQPHCHILKQIFNFITTWLPNEIFKKQVILYAKSLSPIILNGESHNNVFIVLLAQIV